MSTPGAADALIRPVDRDDLDLAAIQPRHRATLGGLLGDLDARPTARATERDRAARGLGLLRARSGR